MSASPEIRVLPDAAAVARAAAGEFSQLAQAAVRSHGRFTVALSGGSTPRKLFELLASEHREDLPWQQTYFFWGDERHVPPDHRDSNYAMADQALLSKLSGIAGNVYRVKAEMTDASAAAADYEQTMRQVFHAGPGEVPRFDLVLLGMGPDGHTASLFPHTQALSETSKLATANWVEKFATYRITLTLPVLNRAASVMFLVTGADKAPALQQVLEFPGQGSEFPAQLVCPTAGRLLWLIDEAAAGALSPTLLSRASRA